MLRTIALMAVFGLAAAVLPGSASAQDRAGGPVEATNLTTVRFAGLDGGEIRLADFAGRPVLVANTASLCGFTPQYGGLQALWETYRAAGLVVIGVPTNDFGNQEPGSAAEIKEFCEVNFNVDFLLAAKATTRGPDRHPFFATVARDLGETALPRWNFHKYLVGGDGELKASWPSPTPPMGAAIVSAVEAELAGAAAIR